MGMFDTITWKDPLPVSPEMVELSVNPNTETGYNFQTKDLESGLDDYSVHGSRLHIQKYGKIEWIAGDTNADRWLDRFGYIDRQDPYWEFVPLTRKIRMYDYISRKELAFWLEYEVTFNEGIVSEIQLVKFQKHDNFQNENNSQLNYEQNNTN